MCVSVNSKRLEISAVLFAVGTAVTAAERMNIPAGQYRALFATAEQAPTEITPFKLDRLPVTNAEFAVFVAAQPRWQRGRIAPLFADSRYLQAWQSDGNGNHNPLPEEAQAPVTHVSWFAAKAFCQARGGRLP
ncbi:MAG TPA: SUMF1/EgtB/PvdO family nonheme iron enzyme, partial [Permianibacter sp.]|nr:SUMF1/EgtB/PvdO family nonheme iron enzyme [Permianibacter sp.]